LLCARKESKIISQASMVFIFDSAFYYMALTVLSFITFSTYAGTENTLTPKKVFTAITLFALLRLYCVQFLNIALLALSELYVAYKRIRVSSQLYIQSLYYYYIPLHISTSECILLRDKHLYTCGEICAPKMLLSCLSKAYLFGI